MADEITATIDAPVETAAPVEVAPLPDSYEAKVESLNPDERKHWDLTGKLPERFNTKSDATATSSTAISETSSSEGTVETEPESEPGITEQSTKTPRNSWKELRNERDRERERAAKAEAKAELLEKQLAQSRTSPPTEPPQETVKPLTEKPQRPKLHDPQWKSAEEYDKAMDAYEEAKERWDRQQLQVRETTRKQTESQQQATQAWTEQIERERKAHSDYDAIAFNPKTPSTWAAIRTLRSLPNGAALQYWLGKPENHAEAQRIAELTHIPGTEGLKLDQIEQLAATYPHIAKLWGEANGIAKVEFSRISERVKKPAVPSKEPAKPPKPTSEVAVDSNTAPIGDPIKAAIASGDTETYERLENARDLERRRLGRR